MRYNGRTPGRRVRGSPIDESVALGSALDMQSNVVPASGAVTRALAATITMWFAAQLQRVAPPAYVGASSLMVDLGTTAAGAGVLASIYFVVYGLMQIPSGILADQSSPRRNLVVGGLAMTVAGLAFAVAPTLELAVAARAAIGMTAGLFWLSSLKLFSELPGGAYARRISVLVSFSSMASILGLAGLPALLAIMNWRLVAALVSLPTLAIAILLMVTPMPVVERSRSAGELWRRCIAALGKIPSIVARADFWAVALIAMLWTGNQFALQTWLPRYARDVMQAPTALTGVLSSLLPVGAVFGSILVGYLHGRHRFFRIPFYVALYTAYLASTVLLASGGATAAGPVALGALLVWMGALQASFFVPLAWIGAKVEASLLGTATGLLNGLTFLPAFVIPWMMGLLMDSHDRPTSPDWVYSAGAYHLAFGVGAATEALALAAAAALYVWIRIRSRKTSVASGTAP
jgi:sugar phosphate permease